MLLGGFDRFGTVEASTEHTRFETCCSLRYEQEFRVVRHY